jgi:hypothetical protein
VNIIKIILIKLFISGFIFNGKTKFILLGKGLKIENLGSILYWVTNFSLLHDVKFGHGANVTPYRVGRRYKVGQSLPSCAEFRNA